MARFIMILVIGAIITYGYTNITLNEYTSQGTQNVVDHFSYNRAHDIANSMVNIILMRLANNSNYRVTSHLTENLDDGTVTYTVKDEFIDGDSLVKIVVSSKFNSISKSVVAFAEIPEIKLDYILPGSAANSDIKVTGSFILDGRNHTVDGTLIPQDGTYALWSTGNITLGGGVTAGGTFNNIDYAPSKPPNPNIIAENQSLSGGFPTTIEGLFSNYPAWAASLKVIAQTGIGGSQYVTNSDNLVFPLQGITYVELPPGQTWSDKQLGGSGFIIVHNQSGTAKIRGHGGTFTGWVAADEVVNFHGHIIGALVSLSAFPQTNNYVFGSSNGTITYSKDAISNTLPLVKFLGYGFGGKRAFVHHWYE